MAAHRNNDTTQRLLGVLRVGRSLDLSARDPAATLGWEKESAKAALADEVEHVAKLQNALFAESKRSVLIVLQAMDAGGKDGVLRDVFTGVNPAGIAVTSFGVPSEEDLAHDYLARVHTRTPAAGQIGVWNRSHYEDVLVVRVKKLAPQAVWRKRFGHIRAFEQLLVDEGTTVVKFFLNISTNEQRQRFQDRVDNSDERWKFRLGDLDDRALWPQFMKAYADAMTETSTKSAPWFVVPADRKWVRNLAIARIVRHTLERIDPKYPAPEPGTEGLTIR